MQMGWVPPREVSKTEGSGGCFESRRVGCHVRGSALRVGNFQNLDGLGLGGRRDRVSADRNMRRLILLGAVQARSGRIANVVVQGSPRVGYSKGSPKRCIISSVLAHCSPGSCVIKRSGKVEDLSSALARNLSFGAT